MATKKKLIEVALPLEAINSASAYEKMPGIGAHPRGLHLWWARRPFVAARAVIWSSLVDDPSSHPEQFPTPEAQQIERDRLFAILTKLVRWENSDDDAVLEEAKQEILRCTDGNPPAFLDPFSGGGAIPFEAQRLGLEAHAHDLNPVAVMINKAMIEIPPKFSGIAPVNPEIRAQVGGCCNWKGTAGLAEDVRYYGEWMRQEAFRRIGHLYPKVKVPQEQGGGEATVITWMWSRTVKCPNPACGCEMPLIKSFALSKKKGNAAYIEPTLVDDHFEYRVKHGKLQKDEGSVMRAGAHCLACGASVPFSYIRDEGSAKRMGSDLTAIVAEGKRGKIYLSPDVSHKHTAQIAKPEDYPSGVLSGKSRVNVSLYGFDETSDLFSNRQLTALTTLSALIAEAQKKAESDAVASGMFNDHIGIADGGRGAQAYGEAIGVYLAFAVDRECDFCNSVCRWSVSNEKPMNLFARQAIPMIWDYPEVNIFSDAVGSFATIVDYVCSCIQKLGHAEAEGVARQFDAQSDAGFRSIMISTDPPYYDNIDYADLSDYFYVWMRQALKKTYPKLFRTLLVPKAEELVAAPFRFEGSVEKAKEFFEDGMYNTCCRLYQYAHDDIPVTIYYAFKQSESEEELGGSKTASTGWETMLSAIIRAGFAITGTWPMRTEQTYRSVSMGTNALASSIVLVCRKRSATASSCTRRDFINALHRELRPALEKLQSANIAPVDLAQSAIGPGIGVFSRYKSVLESDGKPMSVRAALQIINQELDAFYNEQEGELDRDSRFCVDLFNQYAFNNIKFGDADILARAKNTSVEALADQGVLSAAKGTVRLHTREEIPTKVDPLEECTWLLTQQLARALEKGGIKECAQIVVGLMGSNAENAKALAYRLYTICERKNWAQEGYAYNNLVVAWPDIQSMAAQIQAETPVQMTMDI